MGAQNVTNRMTVHGSENATPNLYTADDSAVEVLKPDLPCIPGTGFHEY